MISVTELKEQNLFACPPNSVFANRGKKDVIKWKALSVKAKANRGLFHEIEAEEMIQDKEDFKQVKKLIQGNKTSKQDERKRSEAIASVSGGGGGAKSSKNALRLKKLLSQSEEDPPAAKPKVSGWAKLRKVIDKNAQNFPSIKQGPDLAEIVDAIKKGPIDEDSKARLALVRDARKANRALKSHLKSTSNYAEDDDIGQRRKSRKDKRLQDALPLVPKHLAKRLLGNKKEDKDANLDFYHEFKYIYVDIPEPEEDFPCESIQAKS